MSEQALIDIIIEDWGKQPQAAICISIIKYLYARIENLPSHITYGFLRKVIGDFSYEETDLLLAVQYLCGERLKVLRPRFEFIEGEEAFELSNLEVKQARETGFLIHPETGEQIKSFDDKIFIYFEPAPLIKLTAS